MRSNARLHQQADTAVLNRMRKLRTTKNKTKNRRHFRFLKSGQKETPVVLVVTSHQLAWYPRDVKPWTSDIITYSRLSEVKIKLLWITEVSSHDEDVDDGDEGVGHFVAR